MIDLPMPSRLVIGMDLASRPGGDELAIPRDQPDEMMLMRSPRAWCPIEHGKRSERR